MKTCFKITILACALLSSLHTLAADTPINSSPEEPTVKVADRLLNARNWISASKWSQAIDELSVAVREDPLNADAHNLLGYSYRKQASLSLDKAFEHYNTAIQLNPSHIGAHEYIGKAYLLVKKPAEAEKHLLQLRALCGNAGCAEHAELTKAVAAYKAANP